MTQSFWSYTAPRSSTQQFPVTRVTSRLTPGATPKIISTAGSPRSYSAAVSPKLTSGATSPKPKPRYEGPTVSLSPWIPSSKQSSAANSPPRNRNLPGLFVFPCFWVVGHVDMCTGCFYWLVCCLVACLVVIFTIWWCLEQQPDTIN
jgi:hypothetical protein